MKKIGFFKKISLYFYYRRVLLKNSRQFSSAYNLRIDWVNRIYTVINIPEEVFEEPYNMRTSDINKISDPYITEFVKQISSFLNTKGLIELYDIYDIRKIEKYSYLVVIGFSLFDTDRIARNFLFRILPFFSVISVILIILKHFKLL